MEKPYFLISYHAQERRGISKEMCAKELESSEEISSDIARPLLGRAGLKSRRFPNSRFWVFDNEWMYISQEGESPSFQVVTTCIHIFDRVRQAVLKREPVEDLIKIINPVVFDQPFSVVMSPELYSFWPAPEREGVEQVALEDWIANPKKIYITRDCDGEVISITRSVSGDNSILYLNFRSSGWKVKVSRGLKKIFSKEEIEDIKRMSKEAHQEGLDSLTVEVSGRDVKILLEVEESSLIIEAKVDNSNLNSQPIINWIKLEELE